ncbi:MAG: glycosyltransferase, partial [Rickettsiaceae bacterium]|nr:glycosyltransferase [Rickettsiaceae bacterium]
MKFLKIFAILNLLFFTLCILVYKEKIPRYLIVGSPKINGEMLEALNFIGNDIIAEGVSEAIKHKAIILGITRDNNDDMPMTRATIESLGNLFADYRVVVFENDSKDGTKESLREWEQKNDKVKIISQDFNNMKRPEIQFLADCRNRYLKEIESEKYDDFDILIVIDMDMAYGIDMRGVLDSFSKFGRWDAVCSNG